MKLDNMVDNNEEQTQVDFHQYATSKLQSMLGYEPVDVDGEEGNDGDEDGQVDVENLDNEFENSEEVETEED